MVLPAPEIDTSCRAGIYVRLSVEDKHTHTASIETQQLIIARYLEQNPEIIVVQTYIDNGATGTNFHRPGFQQILSDIEAGLINCVIVILDRIVENRRQLVLDLTQIRRCIRLVLLVSVRCKLILPPSHVRRFDVIQRHPAKERHNLQLDQKTLARNRRRFQAILHVGKIQRHKIMKHHAETAGRLVHRLAFPLQGFLLREEASFLFMDGIPLPVRHTDLGHPAVVRSVLGYRH